MSAPLSDLAFDQAFRTARTRNAWTEESVPETLVRAAYDLMKWGPTSANCSPARFVWIKPGPAKERLKPYLSGNNADKTMSAPWTVIVAWDEKFYDKIPQLFPQMPAAREWFAQAPDGGFDGAFRNGTLQGGYLMIAARMLGLDCGPMSGFNRDGVDKEFLAEKGWKSNFLVNIGYGSDVNLFPRLPRLSFEEANEVL